MVLPLRRIKRRVRSSRRGGPRPARGRGKPLPYSFQETLPGLGRGGPLGLPSLTDQVPLVWQSQALLWNRTPAILWVLSHRWERTSPPKRRNILATVKETLSSPPHPAPSGPPSPQGEGLEKGGGETPLQTKTTHRSRKKDLTSASGSRMYI